MKKVHLMWGLAGLIALIYISTFFVVRFKNPEEIQYKDYQSWRSAYLIHKGKQAFVNTSNNPKHPVALSEAQGYGLQIIARAGAKGWASEHEFNELLNYYLTHRDRVGEHKKTQTFLMQWRQTKRHGKWVSDSNSATDGDLYIAGALSRAAQVWPKHKHYYLSLERKLADDILKYEYNSHTGTLTVGDWADKRSPYYTLMRTSDVMPNSFDRLYHDTNDHRWLAVKDKMLDRLVNLSDQHKTGLVPDFAWVTKKSARPVKAKTVASVNDGNYSANACRVPMMLARSNDPRAKQVLKKMLRFFRNQYYVTAGYTLNGHRLNRYQSASFSAPIFYAVNFNRGRGFDNLFSSQKFIFSKPLPKDNYYDATLTTIAALEGMNNGLK